MPPEQPHMPPLSNHACPPRATMHAPLEQPRMPPGSNHTRPPPEQPHTSPQEQPRMPPLRAITHAPTCGETDTCKNITFANFVCGG